MKLIFRLLLLGLSALSCHNMTLSSSSSSSSPATEAQQLLELVTRAYKFAQKNIDFTDYNKSEASWFELLAMLKNIEGIGSKLNLSNIDAKTLNAIDVNLQGTLAQISSKIIATKKFINADPLLENSQELAQQILQATEYLKARLEALVKAGLLNQTVRDSIIQHIDNVHLEISQFIYPNSLVPNELLKIIQASLENGLVIARSLNANTIEKQGDAVDQLIKTLIPAMQHTASMLADVKNPQYSTLVERLKKVNTTNDTINKVMKNLFFNIEQRIETTQNEKSKEELQDLYNQLSSMWQNHQNLNKDIASLPKHPPLQAQAITKHEDELKKIQVLGQKFDDLNSEIRLLIKVIDDLLANPQNEKYILDETVDIYSLLPSTLKSPKITQLYNNFNKSKDLTTATALLNTIKRHAEDYLRNQATLKKAASERLHAFVALKQDGVSKKLDEVLKEIKALKIVRFDKVAWDQAVKNTKKIVNTLDSLNAQTITRLYEIIVVFTAKMEELENATRQQTSLTRLQAKAFDETVSQLENLFVFIDQLAKQIQAKIKRHKN